MKRTLIFGCNGLLGKSVSEFFYKNNHFVIGVDISKSPQSDFINKYINCDLLKIKDCDQFEDSFLRDLINEKDNINIIDCSLITQTNNLDKLEKIQEFWHGMISFQVLIAKAAGNFALRKRKKINLIFISSVKSFRPPKFSNYEGLNMKSHVEYGMAKAGINLLVKDTTVRYKPFLRCNAIAPGGLAGEDHNPLFLERYNQGCTQSGLVSPSSVAKMINLLASEDSEVSGQVVIVDNGWSLI